MARLFNTRTTFIAFSLAIFFWFCTRRYGPEPSSFSMWKWRDSQEEYSRSSSEVGPIRANLASVLEQLLPDPIVKKKEYWQALTQQGIKRLVQCLAQHGEQCHATPEGKVIIAAHQHFLDVADGQTTGEVIWCESVVVAMEQLGYTILYATGQDEALKYYKLFPDLVRVVIMRVAWGQRVEDNHVRNCFVDPQCILSDTNPTGIAPWKIFGLTWWGTRGDPSDLHHPYGPSRVLVPYEYPGHFHLGYAVDHHCTQVPVIPHGERKNQAFVLAKRLSYLFHKTDAAFLPHMWKPVAEGTGLDLISVAWDDTKGERQIPDGIRGVGRLSRSEFYQQLGSSQALIGNGQPILSPSPLDALCLGVPFIHPYDPTQSLRPEGWSRFRMKYYQHGPLLELGPPLVYHVPQRNVTALIDALQAAKANPIKGRALPDEYTMSALVMRVRKLVEEMEWEGLARREGRIE